MKRVASCSVCMMCRFFVLSALMMLGCFAMVTRGMRVMFCRLLMVFGCFLGHGLLRLLAVNLNIGGTPISAIGSFMTSMVLELSG
jgi:hypothetical protein